MSHQCDSKREPYITRDIHSPYILALDTFPQMNRAPCPQINAVIDLSTLLLPHCAFVKLVEVGVNIAQSFLLDDDRYYGFK